MANKADLRLTCRRFRDALPLPERRAASDSIRRYILSLPEVVAADRVFIYASDGSEVQTYTLIEDLLAMGKTVALPRIIDLAEGQMDAVPITSLKHLAPSPEHFDLLEPSADAPNLEAVTGHAAPDIALLPALAVSPTTGHRLGYGRGFYDRYLTHHPPPRTLPLALVYHAQLRDPLPAEPHDQPAPLIVTERGPIRVGTLRSAES